MNTNPKTCKIAKGTTLEELAKFFSLSKEQLKRYHNIYCPLQDLIEVDIPEHVTIVYVPPEDKALREKIFNPNGGNFISYKSKNALNNTKSFQKRYGIIQKVFHNEEEKYKLHYELEIKKQGLKVEITRKAVYLNHQRPDLIVEQFADKVSNIVYPLHLDLHENGSIKDITNLKEIQNRWQKLKPQLEEYYKGETIEKIIKKIEKQIQSKNGTLNKLKDSFFYFFYFMPIYENFDEDRAFSTVQEVPFVNEDNKIPYEILLSIDDELSKTKKLFLTAKGNSIDTPFFSKFDKTTSPEDKMREKPKPNGFFDFTYKLNSTDNSIFSIYGELGFKFSTYHKKVTFECYEQIKS